MSSDDIKKGEPTEEVLFIKKSLKNFSKTFGIIGLAIAFGIGQAASGLVTSFVDDIINPLIELFLPAGNLDAVSVQVPSISGRTTEFRIGQLKPSIIDFLIIALVAFLAYKQLSRFKLVDDKTIPEKK
jgi:large conductance mechanosensitive channel